MDGKRILLSIFLFACWTVSVLGQSLGSLTRSEDVGFSSERLARITNFF